MCQTLRGLLLQPTQKRRHDSLTSSHAGGKKHPSVGIFIYARGSKQPVTADTEPGQKAPEPQPPQPLSKYNPPLVVGFIILCLIFLLVIAVLIKYLFIDNPNEKQLTITQDRALTPAQLDRVAEAIRTSDSRLAGCWQQIGSSGRVLFLAEGNLLSEETVTPRMFRYSYNAAHAIIVDEQRHVLMQPTYDLLQEGSLVLDGYSWARCQGTQSPGDNDKAPAVRCFPPFVKTGDSCCADFNVTAFCPQRDQQCEQTINELRCPPPRDPNSARTRWDVLRENTVDFLTADENNTTNTSSPPIKPQPDMPRNIGQLQDACDNGA